MFESSLSSNGTLMWLKPVTLSSAPIQLSQKSLTWECFAVSGQPCDTEAVPAEVRQLIALCCADVNTSLLYLPSIKLLKHFHQAHYEEEKPINCIYGVSIQQYSTETVSLKPWCPMCGSVCGDFEWKSHNLSNFHFCKSLVCSNFSNWVSFWNEKRVAITQTNLESAVVTENLGSMGPVFKTKSGSSTRKKEGERRESQRPRRDERRMSLLSLPFLPPGTYCWSLSFFLSFITEVIKPCAGALLCLITPTVNKRSSGGDGGGGRRRGTDEKTKQAQHCVIIILKRYC